MNLSHDQQVSALRRARGTVIGVNREVSPPVPVRRIVANRSANAGTAEYGRPVAVSVAAVLDVGQPAPESPVWRPTCLLDVPDPSDRLLADAMRRARIGR